MPDLGCWGGSIVTYEDAHPEIAFMKCKCGKRGWHTKNIGYFGARSIYTFKGGCQILQDMVTCNPECSCPVKDISIDEEMMEHTKNCSECQRYGYRWDSKKK